MISLDIQYVSFNQILWDELFQTNDVICLYKAVSALLNGRVDKDRWELVRLGVTKGNEDSFVVDINIANHCDGDISGVFEYTREELFKLEEELKGYTKLYPVVVQLSVCRPHSRKTFNVNPINQ